MHHESLQALAGTSGWAPASSSDPGHYHAALRSALRQRGLECTIEYGLSDYIVHAELPDGSSLIISPPQEPPSQTPEPAESWMATRHWSTEPAVYEVIYDSEPDGPHAYHGGSVPDLLTAVDARLDQLGVPPRQEQEPSAQERAGNVLPPASAPSRASIALTPSLSVGQHVLPTGPQMESPARAAPPPARPSPALGR